MTLFIDYGLFIIIKREYSTLWVVLVSRNLLKRRNLCRLRNDVWETSAGIPYWWRVIAQIWAVLLIGWSKFRSRYHQSEVRPRCGYWQVISMEFLRSFLRRHFAGKPVVASRNVGCFVRLTSFVISFRILMTLHTETEIGECSRGFRGFLVRDRRRLRLPNGQFARRLCVLSTTRQYKMMN